MSVSRLWRKPRAGSPLQRNLIYTGITRGRRLVVLVEQKKALEMAVRGSRAADRWSRLGEWLRSGMTGTVRFTDST